MMFPSESEERIVTQNGKKGLNPYWVGLLSPLETAQLKAFDFACETYTNAFQSYLDDFEDAEESETFLNAKKEITQLVQEKTGRQVDAMREDFIISMIESIEDSVYEGIYKAELAKARKEFGRGIADLYGLEDR